MASLAPFQRKNYFTLASPLLDICSLGDELMSLAVLSVSEQSDDCHQLRILYLCCSAADRHAVQSHTWVRLFENETILSHCHDPVVIIDVGVGFVGHLHLVIAIHYGRNHQFTQSTVHYSTQ